MVQGHNMSMGWIIDEMSYEKCDNDGDVLLMGYLLIHTNIYIIKNKIYIPYTPGYLHTDIYITYTGIGYLLIYTNLYIQWHKVFRCSAICPFPNIRKWVMYS